MSVDLEGFEFWELDRYLVIKSNKGVDTISKVLDHYGLEVKIYDKRTKKEITTDPSKQVMSILRKANKIHGQAYFVLNLNKGKLERKLVRKYWTERMAERVDLEIARKTDPEGKIYCPECLKDGKVVKLKHEGGCKSCMQCFYEACEI